MGIVGTLWNPEPLPLVGLLVAGSLYGLGVKRLTDRGRKWPLKRTVPFAGGLMVLAIALLSPLADQDTRLFSAHAFQHLLLSMLGPVLLCLGAPITLALQAAGRPWQTRLLKALAWPVVRFLTFPIVSWMIFAGTLFLLYFTGLYELSLRNAVFHDIVHVHFVMAGFLFFSAVVSIDPHPWRMAHGLRMLYVGLTLPVHAFLALALMSAAMPLAPDWYTLTTGRDLATVLTDQKLGAAIMWIAGDFLAIVTVGIVAIQWSREDERSANREDRYVDSHSVGAEPAEPVI